MDSPFVSRTVESGYHAISSAQFSSNPYKGVARPTLPGMSELVGGSVKRCFDLVLASMALLMILPLIIITTLAILITMGRPIFFSQQRIGWNGKKFKCYKFRTMVNNADRVLDRILAEDKVLARQWRENQKLERDPRVTELGLILRKTSIDELPQLLNVLKGDMSCIGPRPIVSAELSKYGFRARHYLSARPGITGMWQVSGRSKLNYKRRVALDSFYVKKWSLYLDFLILIKTVRAVLRFNETG